MKRKGIRTKLMISIGRERINKLFKLAESSALNRNFALAKRYVELARKIGTRYNIRLGKEQKGKFCKKCGSFLLQGYNAKTRIARGRITITCLNCMNIRRMNIRKNE
ncbi:MAG: hypothetical protein AB1779_02455 [Candidatus Thermoplasmatota archaeon]